MTKATRVLSTPPTNTPIDTTRRHLLTVAASGAVAAAGIATGTAATAGAVFDTALTELVAKFERLLGEYYARQRAWGPRLAQAHAETDELFGKLVNGDNAEDRSRFFSEACARLDVHEVSDRLHAVGEEMKPLARAIVALPTTSLEALRAKALVVFWEVAPLCAGDTSTTSVMSIRFSCCFLRSRNFAGSRARSPRPVTRFRNCRICLAHVTKTTRRKRDDRRNRQISLRCLPPRSLPKAAAVKERYA
jgi:hypothetical protein